MSVDAEQVERRSRKFVYWLPPRAVFSEVATQVLVNAAAVVDRACGGRGGSGAVIAGGVSVGGRHGEVSQVENKEKISR